MADDLHLALVRAAAEGDAPFVSQLLAHGADPRPRRLTFYGEETPAAMSALGRAVLSPNAAGGEAVVAALLDDGRIDVLANEYCVSTRLAPEICARKATQLDSNGVTLVHYAAAKGRMRLLDLCLHHARAPANAADADGHYGPVATSRGGRCTPLHVAALADRGAAVDALLDAGAELHARDCDGFDPLYLAARFGCDDALSALLRRDACDPNVSANAGHTPIFLAARYGHLTCVFKLLRAGASLALRELPSGTRTPAGYAIHKTGPDNCDGRVREQRAVIEWLASCYRTGGVAAWCARDRHDLAGLRALALAGRADYRPTMCFAASSQYFAKFNAGRAVGVQATFALVARYDSVVAALFSAKSLPDEIFGKVVEFWLEPRAGYKLDDDRCSLMSDDDRASLSLSESEAGSFDSFASDPDADEDLDAFAGDDDAAMQGVVV